MISSYFTQGLPISEVANWSSIISATVAVLAIILGIWVSGALYQTVALMNRRRRSIWPIVRDIDTPTSWNHFIKSSWSLLSSRARTGQAKVRDEMIWLSQLMPAAATEPDLSNAYPVFVPFTFSERIAHRQYSSTLIRLSAAYTAYGSSVRQRWLLRSAAGPLVEQEHECAKATADLLMRWASFEPLPPPSDPAGIRGKEVELAPGTRPRSIRLVTWPEMNAARATPSFPVLGTSYQPYRVVLEGSPASKIRTDPKDIRVVENVTGTATSNPLTFDGVLPRWHGPGFRLEIDRITGRQKLHLCVAETTYFAFRATQEPDAVAVAGDAALCSRLLGLNLLAFDQNGFVVLIRRSNYVVYPGGYAGTVTGNAELVSREGLDADLDQYGLPDMLAAIAREAREELGLDLTLEEAQLAALGVIEYNGESDQGSRALVTTARLQGRACDFRVARSAPDPVEGLWEIGDEFITVDLAAVLHDPDKGQRFVSWVRSSQDLAPQAAGSLLLLLAARLELLERQLARAAKNKSRTDPPRWTTRELGQWLDAPLTEKPTDVHDIVQRYPLWR